ncbi:DNA polymerase III, subunit gamma and tau [Candidatus Woesebacteria bacterium RIFCSPLOWO2_01_FULL_39_23]|uniref:DNA polymerase III subunit gamma/tau n=1 Tax=Candidatus Woesebacteria bacterium RIFCSPHIGHO2_01_FULL_40_22 TaxID=1802499 RepID=A0A1F7YK85_9BACT|nr:MAG: DNA polymerase III, subunit gamma and tau [Candidatus Woesebacteria bacterium RBG_16_40_11]OGM26935.1 MAG: DNA polymerase III, subunit gamma and tau [Candidatus Woesebacteria bacterium RIFCSPHIGHO2_01_FULL_40_22]OGM37344.1 MAG: DNA polymerase III, subunit gamma and tau [Candidatus Woesebacteria bacterium RIFCSPHIGHO2_12_FULL_38_9]OGM63209.1 MAG: DNA polymerase III, subunit gamma and tau [Candidatus Woesebacteria bacterium RIFCSPLOWO2_01_FULL_39_23]
MTFYLKYRPQTLDDLDLADVRDTLGKIVESGNLPHAFLFYGPKGSGKTSAARIIAKVVNCEHPSTKGEPCNKCYQCKSITNNSNIDVIEIDAASHRGIDDIREIRNAVKLTPAKANKKVYIIDEAHMLTSEASNALLKTLEEPPRHVLFILATTNWDKIIDTIRSRTLNVNFGKASIEELVRSLRKSSKGEKLKIGNDALNLIATASDGSFREAQKIFEQLILQGCDFDPKKLEEELFKKANLGSVNTIISSLSDKDAKTAVSEIEKVASGGGSIETLTKKLIDRFRSALFSEIGLEGVSLEGFTKSDLISLIESLNISLKILKSAFMEQIPLELAVIKWCERKLKTSNLKLKTEVGDDSKKDSDLEDAAKPHRINSQASNSDKEIKISVSNQKEAFDGNITDDIWREILIKTRSKSTSTEALLRASKPLTFNGETLTLGVFYSFHKERLEEPFHKRILEDVLTGILDSDVRVICNLASPPERKKEIEAEKKEDINLTEPEDEDIIKIAKEIFEN